MKAAEALSKRMKVPDPHGMILRIKRKMRPNCSVMLSPFCEQLIAMRMQGVPYIEMERWTLRQGPEHRIPSATLFRNFQSVKEAIELPEAEKLAEQWGGSFDFNTTRMLAGQIILQRNRIDRMLRAEEEKQKVNSLYMDKRIRAEMETLTVMAKNYQQMLRSPIDAANDLQEEQEKAASQEIELSSEALVALTDLVLSDKVRVGKE